MVAARGAFPAWAGATAYLRGQILYRVAEMMEGRRAQFEAELADAGAADPARGVSASIDRWVWYAGWADKLAQVLGATNPVAGPYFNFTVPEPTGVVGIVAPGDQALLGLVSRLAPAIVERQHRRRDRERALAAAGGLARRGARHERRARRRREHPHRAHAPSWCRGSRATWT